MMFFVEEIGAVISRLTSAQRSLLAHLPAATSGAYVSPLPSEVGLMRGFYQMELVVRHPTIPSLFCRTLFGDAVVEVLLDTEAVRVDG